MSRFSGAKGISSDALFNKGGGDSMDGAAAARFGGSSAISSDAYFNREPEADADVDALALNLNEVAFQAREAGRNLADSMNKFMDRVRYG